MAMRQRKPAAAKGVVEAVETAEAEAEAVETAAVALRR